jgi:hypothetical protein
MDAGKGLEGFEMFCEKCRGLAAGAIRGPAQTDLVQLSAQFHKRPANGRLEACTDTYECRRCKTTWKVDFDPAMVPSYSAFRRVGRPYTREPARDRDQVEKHVAAWVHASWARHPPVTPVR